jgi:hypothetical protein
MMIPMPKAKTTSLLMLILLALTAACATGAADTTGRRTSINSPITAEEVERSTTTNAWDLVLITRPGWLRTRTQTTRRSAIVVYVNNARMGDTQFLREINTADIERVEYLDSRTATFRFGQGHSEGVILVTTRAR